jgi:hypothetical protein
MRADAAKRAFAFLIVYVSLLGCGSFGSVADTSDAGKMEPNPNRVSGIAEDWELASLSVSAASLSPMFDSTTHDYTAGPVRLSTLIPTTTTVTATTRSTYARIKIAGVDVASGTPSSPSRK